MKLMCKMLDMSPSQEHGYVWETARKIFLEHPFISPADIAKILNVARSRVYACVEGLAEQRAVVQKRTLKELKRQYGQETIGKPVLSTNVHTRVTLNSTQQIRDEIKRVRNDKTNAMLWGDLIDMLVLVLKSAEFSDPQKLQFCREIIDAYTKRTNFEVPTTSV